MPGYLFAHFTGEQKDGEQIYFSISRDGLHWEDMNGGRPVLVSHIGTGGVRDPFLVQNPDNGTTYLIATDLRIEAGHGWDAAQESGSRDLIVWESVDLVHWSKERACTVGVPKAGCVWAPEAVYDSEKKEFFVFFASRTKQEGETRGKHRIYAVYTKNFVEFSKPFVYLEREKDVIDTTIWKAKDCYYRVSKDESDSRLLLECSDSLQGEFTEINSEVLKELKGVEGPEGYLLPDGKTWCLIVDRFAEGKGYLPLLSEDLEQGVFRVPDPQEYDMGEGKKRHGGVLKVTDEELGRLRYYYDRKNPVIEGLYADPDLYYEHGTYYLYTTTDGFPGWSGHVFSVFSSEDGRSFQKVTDILDVASAQVPWAKGSAWAPCLAKKNGKYYFYFCAKEESGRSCIGAAIADLPTGPFYAMPEPMITLELLHGHGIRMSQAIDPSICLEGEDVYILFGNGEAAIARLTADMCHIQMDTLKNLEGLSDFRESVIVTERDGIYHFTWSCGDTGSEDYHVNYGISDSLYGPVDFVGTILEKDPKKGVLGTGHHSILKMPDNETYFIAYHRFATPLEAYPEGKGWHREVCIAPLEFDEEGRIIPVIIN